MCLCWRCCWSVSINSWHVFEHLGLRNVVSKLDHCVIIGLRPNTAWSQSRGIYHIPKPVWSCYVIMLCWLRWCLARKLRGVLDSWSIFPDVHRASSLSVCVLYAKRFTFQFGALPVQFVFLFSLDSSFAVQFVVNWCPEPVQCQFGCVLVC